MLVEKVEANVEGIGIVPFRVLWFVVAGFLLGFTTSTLWEWLYYRQIRLRRLGEHRQMDAGAQRGALPSGNDSAREQGNGDRDMQQGHRTADGVEWQLRAYRSSGVFLESERVLPSPPATGQERPQSSSSTPPRSSPPSPVMSSALSSQRVSAVPLRNGQAPPANTDWPGAVTATPKPPTVTNQMPAAQVDAPARAAPQSFSAMPNPHATNTHDASVAGGREVPSIGSDHGAVTDVTIAKIPGNSSPLAAFPASVSAHQSAEPPDTPRPSHGRATIPRSGDHPDNLASVKGIGEAYKRRLYATGIYTWRQLAESDTDSLRRITRAKPNADIHSWQTQAREMAEKHNRWDAHFVGPLDDFTRIEGIGAITADILYKVGICIYEQLAETTVDELERVVPAPTVGDENDFEGWIRTASHLASAKQRNGGRLP